jgi:hypothetical protein
MRSILAVALALLPQEASRTKPVPPPIGSGVHVTSSLTSKLAIRFTADGKELRKFDRKVGETSDVTIEVVASLADGLDLKPNEAALIDTPAAPPPYVRARYERCPVKVTGPEGTDESDAEESSTIFYFERSAEPPKARKLYGGSFKPESSLPARLLADADSLLVGPRFAPLVLNPGGRELAAGATLDVDAEVVAPLVAQVVADGTVTKAQLAFRGVEKDGANELLAFGITLSVAWKGSDDLPVTATFELAGDLKLVKATAQLFALNLSGPIRYGGSGDENGAKLEIAGTGSLDFTYRADPLVAK